MKFIITDRDDCGYYTEDGFVEYPEKVLEFDSLESFVSWATEMNIPRFKIYAPKEGKNENGEHHMIYCMSDYD